MIKTWWATLAKRECEICGKQVQKTITCSIPTYIIEEYTVINSPVKEITPKEREIEMCEADYITLCNNIENLVKSLTELRQYEKECEDGTRNV